MKKLFYSILFLATAFLAAPAFGQVGLQTSPKVVEGGKIIYSDAGGRKLLITADTTDAVDLSNLRGAVTLFVSPDSLQDGVTGNLTFEVLLYSDVTGRWSKYHTAAIDSINVPAAKLNVGAGEDAVTDLYIPLANFDSFAWADKIKFALTIASGDSLSLLVGVGGQ